MKKTTFFTLSLLLFNSFVAKAGVKCPALGPKLSAQEYCEKYGAMAREQMARHGIPASITLAQGMIESGYGSSYLAVKANNHFGIKAYGWRGQIVRCDDDAQDEAFCAFSSVKEGFEYHSTFLLTNSRYGKLFKLDIRDYEGWARGLKECGYATNPNYANMLISTIERYKLYNYDQQDVFIPSGQHVLYSTSASRKALKYVRCKKDDNLRYISREFNVSVSRLLRYNDLTENYQLKENDIIYLEPKHSKPESTNNSTHVVKAGESLWSISQYYGIKLKSLMKRNNMKKAIVREGQMLRLR